MDPRKNLDEHALRRYEWIDGIAVRLANGQEWIVPSLPVVELRWPRRRFLRRRFHTVEVGTFGPDARVCEAILDAVLRRPDRPAQATEQARLCFHALRINYEIGPEEATGLVDLKAQFWIFVRILLGQDPCLDRTTSGATGAGSPDAAASSDASRPE